MDPMMTEQQQQPQQRRRTPKSPQNRSSSTRSPSRQLRMFRSMKVSLAVVVVVATIAATTTRTTTTHRPDGLVTTVTTGVAAGFVFHHQTTRPNSCPCSCSCSAHLHHHGGGGGGVCCAARRRSDSVRFAAAAATDDEHEHEHNELFGLELELVDPQTLEHLVVASSLSYLSSSDGTMQASPYYYYNSNNFVDANTNANANAKNATTGWQQQQQQSKSTLPPLLEPLVQVVDPKSESGATVFRSNLAALNNNNDDDSDDDDDDDDDGSFTTTTTLVVAFRGSATPINFSTNLKFRLVPLNNKDETENETTNSATKTRRRTVHEGFRDSSEGLWAVLEPELETIARRFLKNDNDNERCSGSIRAIFTGHSLGAANAVLCAAKHREAAAAEAKAGSLSSSSSSLLLSSPSFSLSGVLTFGGPRLVNTALADDWNERLFSGTNNNKNENSNSNSNNAARSAAAVVVRNYVHNKDPILRQNGPLWEALGFGILGREVLCEHDRPVVYRHEHYNNDDRPGNNNNKNNNNNNNNNLPVAWNILDHCKYLGIFVGPRLFR